MISTFIAPGAPGGGPELSHWGILMIFTFILHAAPYITGALMLGAMGLIFFTAWQVLRK